jgi:sugar/nucleoside kinase (ribokinase family)
MNPTPVTRKPQLLVIGHVTRDEVAGGLRLGGAASYAALAAARLGVETALLTVAPPDEPLLAPLYETPHLQLQCVPSEVMTTFALDYADGRRRLRLRARARNLSAADLPGQWLGAPVAYAGPVTGEVDAGLIFSLLAGFVGAGLQGWLRRADPTTGEIEPALASEALEPPRLQAAIVSELDHPTVPIIAGRFAAAGAVVAVTRGAEGATVLAGGTRLDVPAVPADEVDPTGAGDVFGVVFTLRLAAGAPPAVAGAAAAAAAARVVEGPGIGRL